MSTYVIGDIQGCFQPLMQLLEHISFNEKIDTLWFTGDIVNRGPQSLESLRFIKKLGNHHCIVLGNHDLHLLAVAYNTHKGWPEDTFTDVLTAPDRNDLLEWLIHRPLLHHDPTLGYTMVHAGMAASWDLTTAQTLAKEVETALQSTTVHHFFKNMYGNYPNAWSNDLQGFDRLRCITNFFTRARFCHADGRLELKNKGKIDSNDTLLPWFKIPNRKNANLNIVFGHWAALGGITHTPHTHAVDTGCIWGYALTAMRLEDNKRFSIACGRDKA